MASKTALAVSDALYLKPLLQGLSAATSPFSLSFDIPGRNALKLAERAENIKAAFLSPLDYARHGGEFRIIPEIAVSSSTKTDTIQLFVDSDARNITTLAVDIRVTSEILLAKIILSENFRNLSAKEDKLQILPMLPDVQLMLEKADAALIVNLDAPARSEEKFVLDLVEEWNDLTDLPYVHGFWVAREGDLLPGEMEQLLDAKKKGLELQTKIAQEVALEKNVSAGTYISYLSSFSYDLGNSEQESISEFFRFSYFYGALGDIPDLNFFESTSFEGN